MTVSLAQLRADALAIYRAAIDGADPRRALTEALAETRFSAPAWIIAAGKAARPMALAALAHLDRLPVPIRGGLVVTAGGGGASWLDPRLRHLVGDHPLPGKGSETAATAVGAVVGEVTSGDDVLVLLSGGATSLLGAPIAGISGPDYRDYLAVIGAAGLPIAELNRLRKRFSRWGAGRLAVAIPANRIVVFAVSDVPGDELSAIGSGPCEPDPTLAAEVRSLLERLGLVARLPAAILAELDRTIAGVRPETAKATEPAFHRVTNQIIASNAIAVDQAAARAAALGYHLRRLPGPVVGEAAIVGASLARQLATESGGPRPTAWIGGGETTVTLGDHPGRGGRCQELVLAAARQLAASHSSRPVALLAAGTDGRDGPTDAAGGIVDRGTWPAITARGIDAEAALERHDAYPALDAVSSLIRIGLTDTNVMDVIVGLAG